MDGPNPKDSPEGRLAQAAIQRIIQLPLCVNCRDLRAFKLDEADMQEYLLPYVLLELLGARYNEHMILDQSTPEQRAQRKQDLGIAIKTMRTRIDGRPKN
jgi:hypothetical protein